ncbi:agmatine deiminase family protein [Halorhodospira halochloris]|nr:agmatine deiminase family protein [Halorhodospira halochloris]MBK1652055.1 agmatine deiminase [Halorhodospira halochloris]
MSALLRPELQIPRLPAEWEPHAALMLTWPHANSDWGKDLPEVEDCFERLAVSAAQFEPLIVVCNDQHTLARVNDRLLGAGVDPQQLVLVEARSNDVWARDHGPLTTINPDGTAQLLDFHFNGWGGRHASDADDRIVRTLTEQGVIGAQTYRRIEWVLEGGSIDCDGAGTLLTTSSCLLNPNRNGEASREQVEAKLTKRLGGHRVIWLDDGWLAGDDTDGHVDMLARFIDNETIAHVVCEDPQDPHYEPLQRMRETLQQTLTMNGEPYSLIELPMPAPIYDEQGHRLPATYANFTFVNGGLLVPGYADRADSIAVERLAAARPDRQVLSVPAKPLIRQGGSIHCATMQLPRGVYVACGSPQANAEKVGSLS